MADPTRKQPRQARSAATVDAIFDAAEQLFHRDGVASVTTVDIAEAASISIGRLYYWFPDKDAIIAGVMQRAERLVSEFLQTNVVDDPGRASPDLVGWIINSLADFVRAHPGALAVLQRHQAPGDDVSPDRQLFRMFEALAAGIVSERVPDIPTTERDLVAGTCVRLALAMLQDYARQPDGDDRTIVDELHYVLSAYLYARYPDANDPVWEDASYPIQPARRPLSRDGTSAIVTPPLAPPRGIGG